jgi:AraC-like DNA-binding protein
LNCRIVIIEPSPLFKPFIRFYKYIESDVIGILKIVSIPDVELYFNYTHVNLFSKNYYNVDDPKILITGLHNIYQEAYTHMYGTGRGGGFAIVFKPMGFYNLFKIKGSDFSGYSLDGNGIFKSELENVWERMYKVYDSAMMKEIVEKFLTKYAQNNPNKNIYVNDILEYMKLNNGLLHTSQVCQKFNVTPRKLQRCLKEETGLTPKDLLNIYRVNYALKMLSCPNPYKFSEISYFCGYYDQSHFIKDIKKIAGITPGEFVSDIEKLKISIADRNFIAKK